MGKKEILQNKKYNLPRWLMVIVVIYFIWALPFADGNYLRIISLICFIISARYAYQLARRLDKKGIFAILLCLVFNLIGLFAYWIYYKIRVRQILANKKS